MGTGLAIIVNFLFLQTFYWPVIQMSHNHGHCVSCYTIASVIHRMMKQSNLYLWLQNNGFGVDQLYKHTTVFFL